MSIRSILVHVDASSSSAMRLQFARELGDRFDARVTALYAMTPFAFTVPALYAPEAVSMLSEVDEQRRDEARLHYDQVCREGRRPIGWAELSGASTTECVVEQSRYADLVVLGQRNPHYAMASAIPSNFVESVVLQGGRPTLVLPYTGPVRSRARRVIVAWNGSAEAARALTAALPLLDGDSQVHVVGWAGGEKVATGDILDVSVYLALHGIKAHVQLSFEPNVDVGMTLLNAVSDLSADLLVMGCYGHSRAREWALGGATRTILQSMTTPVLMAH